MLCNPVGFHSSKNNESQHVTHVSEDTLEMNAIAGDVGIFIEWNAKHH